jgi:bacteriorhodopsin
MLIAEHTFYLLVTAVAAVTTVPLALVAARAQVRSWALLAPAVTGLIALGYLGMGTQALTVPDPAGEPVTVSRFVTYLFTYTSVVATIGILADVGRRGTALGVLGLVGYTGGVLVNWILPAPLNSAGQLAVLGSTVFVLYLLFRPYSRSVQSVSGARQLLFGKLRNLMALLLLMYLIVGLTSRQGLGLLDAFTGVYIGGYLDLLGHVGYAGLLLRGGTAIEELAAQYPSPVAYLKGDTTTRPDPEAAPSD